MYIKEILQWSISLMLIYPLVLSVIFPNGFLKHFTSTRFLTSTALRQSGLLSLLNNHWGTSLLSDQKTQQIWFPVRKLLNGWCLLVIMLFENACGFYRFPTRNYDWASPATMKSPDDHHRVDEQSQKLSGPVFCRALFRHCQQAGLCGILWHLRSLVINQRVLFLGTVRTFCGL